MKGTSQTTIVINKQRWLWKLHYVYTCVHRNYRTHTQSVIVS